MVPLNLSLTLSVNSMFSSNQGAASSALPCLIRLRALIKSSSFCLLTSVKNSISNLGQHFAKKKGLP